MTKGINTILLLNQASEVRRLRCLIHRTYVMKARECWSVSHRILLKWLEVHLSLRLDCQTTLSCKIAIYEATKCIILSYKIVWRHFAAIVDRHRRLCNLSATFHSLRCLLSKRCSKDSRSKFAIRSIKGILFALSNLFKHRINNLNVANVWLLLLPRIVGSDWDRRGSVSLITAFSYYFFCFGSLHLTSDLQVCHVMLLPLASIWMLTSQSLVVWSWFAISSAEPLLAKWVIPILHVIIFVLNGFELALRDGLLWAIDCRHSDAASTTSSWWLGF